MMDHAGASDQVTLPGGCFALPPPPGASHLRQLIDGFNAKDTPRPQKDLIAVEIGRQWERCEQLLGKQEVNPEWLKYTQSLSPKQREIWNRELVRRPGGWDIPLIQWPMPRSATPDRKPPERRTEAPGPRLFG